VKAGKWNLVADIGKKPADGLRLISLNRREVLGSRELLLGWWSFGCGRWNVRLGIRHGPSSVRIYTGGDLWTALELSAA